MLGWFRRHATILMVVLGSAAMVIFGLGQVFDSFARSAIEKVRVNPVVANWAGGEITRDDVMGVYRNHAESVRFLAAVIDAAETKTGDRVRSLADRIAPIQSEDQDQLMGEVLWRLMMAQAAEKQGFVVNDGLVKEYILLISGNAQFSNADLEVINRSVNQGSLDVVKEHLKIELQAMQMGRLSDVGMSLPPNPTEAISLYGRTAERIECEVIPIEVSDFVGKVTEKPSDSELRELFKDGKNEFWDPTGEKPGFKVDRKINMQYFVAEAETFLQNEMSAITDEEVQKEYDRLVASNDFIVVEPVVQDNSFVFPGLDSLPAMPNGDADSGSAPAMPGDDAPAMPGDDAPAMPGDDAPAMPSDDAPAMPSDDAPAMPSDDAPAMPADDAPAAPVVPESGALTVSGTRAQFVSVQEADKPAADKAKMDEQAKMGEATESVELPQADLPLAGGIGADIDEELKKQEAAPERKYKPLIDVAGDIRRSLALPIANAKMTEAIETVNFELEDYFSEHEGWERDDSDDPSEKPELPDFEKMAKQLNLRLKQTGLVDRDAMKLDPLGGIELGGSSLGDYLLLTAGDKKLYEGTPFGGASAIVPDYYLFWNVENENPRVADFDECKERVVKFWTNAKALELAKQEAESISNQVNDDRKSKLSELFTDRAVPTGQFSWFDTVRGGNLSKPGNVDQPSDDFMETAFSLVELEAGVAVDRNRDTVYVVQSISGSRPVSELGADYLQNSFLNFKRVPSEVNRAAVYYSRQEFMKARAAFIEQLGFEYDPDYSN